jgi:signal transduction histidine kinase
MNFFRWRGFERLRGFFGLREPDAVHERERIHYMERNVALPAKGAFIVVLFYYLFFSNWLDAMSNPNAVPLEAPPRERILEIVRLFFLIYVAINAGVAFLLLGTRLFSLRTLRLIVFNSAWFDGLFLGTLTMVTGGFDSFLYWVFLGLIIRTAVSVPVASRQIVLNCVISSFYVLAGVMNIVVLNWESRLLDPITLFAIQQGPQDTVAEPVLLRLTLLILITICCYGVQVLFERQRLAQAEAHEFALRQEQLQATGRLAAEIAHQLKNPLGIINNAAFTLQKTVKEGRPATQQIQIIREEVERSDRILTELMGYARLTEGKVERLEITEELDRAIHQVFPPGAKYDVNVTREYAAALPPLLAQRGHLSEVFVNLLQNAREAMGGVGSILVKTQYGDNFAIVVHIEDNGPGIPAEKLPKIFEPYFTTKDRGTGLGLAIVKHNTELYNGTVQVESEVGKGTRFTVTLPARTAINIRK